MKQALKKLLGIAHPDAPYANGDPPETTAAERRWDATHAYIRDGIACSNAMIEVERLRRLGIPLTGNILEDNATGAASRYRRYRRTGINP